MADRAPENKEVPSSDMPTKKPYAAPVLLHWGTFGELTQTNGRSNQKDGHGPQRGTN
jgi:hypothetical protein